MYHAMVVSDMPCTPMRSERKLFYEAKVHRSELNAANESGDM